MAILLKPDVAQASTTDKENYPEMFKAIIYQNISRDYQKIQEEENKRIFEEIIKQKYILFLNSIFNFFKDQDPIFVLNHIDYEAKVINLLKVLDDFDYFHKKTREDKIQVLQEVGQIYPELKQAPVKSNQGPGIADILSVESNYGWLEYKAPEEPVYTDFQIRWMNSPDGEFFWQKDIDNFWNSVFNNKIYQIDMRVVENEDGESIMLDKKYWNEDDLDIFYRIYFEFNQYKNYANFTSTEENFVNQRLTLTRNIENATDQMSESMVDLKYDAIGEIIAFAGGGLLKYGMLGLQEVAALKNVGRTLNDVDFVIPNAIKKEGYNTNLGFSPSHRAFADETLTASEKLGDLKTIFRNGEDLADHYKEIKRITDIPQEQLDMFADFYPSKLISYSRMENTISYEFEDGMRLVMGTGVDSETGKGVNVVLASTKKQISGKTFKFTFDIGEMFGKSDDELNIVMTKIKQINESFDYLNESEIVGKHLQEMLQKTHPDGNYFIDDIQFMDKNNWLKYWDNNPNSMYTGAVYSSTDDKIRMYSNYYREDSLSPTLVMDKERNMEFKVKWSRQQGDFMHEILHRITAHLKREGKSYNKKLVEGWNEYLTSQVKLERFLKERTEYLKKIGKYQDESLIVFDSRLGGFDQPYPDEEELVKTLHYLLMKKNNMNYMQASKKMAEIEFDGFVNFDDYFGQGAYDELDKALNAIPDDWRQAQEPMKKLIEYYQRMLK